MLALAGSRSGRVAWSAPASRSSAPAGTSGARESGRPAPGGRPGRGSGWVYGRRYVDRHDGEVDRRRIYIRLVRLRQHRCVPERLLDERCTPAWKSAAAEPRRVLNVPKLVTSPPASRMIFTASTRNARVLRVPASCRTGGSRLHDGQPLARELVPGPRARTSAVRHLRRSDLAGKHRAYRAADGVLHPQPWLRSVVGGCASPQLVVGPAARRSGGDESVPWPSIDIERAPARTPALLPWPLASEGGGPARRQ